MTISSEEDENREQMLPPDRVIVGVDLGYTHTGMHVHNVLLGSTKLEADVHHYCATGVAICSPDRMGPGESITPVVIQRWPSVEKFIINKVPTLVTYRAGDFHINSWGFACPPLGEIGPAMSVRGYFKFFLDEDHLIEANREIPEDEQYDIRSVRGWYTDFLTALHSHIIAHLEAHPWLVDWSSTKVEYIFSLPTMWKDRDDLVRDFEGIVRQTFNPGENCSVVIGLTEGEASAVYTAKGIGHQYKKDDALLVCDAGGGTTDICILKVEKIDGKAVELVRLNEAQAIYAGSVQIDRAFEKKVEEELRIIKREHPGLQQGLQEHTAHHMSRGHVFQNIKASFRDAGALPSWSLSVPGLPNNSDVNVYLTVDEIKDMFDGQINKIFRFIDSELGKLQQTSPDLKVSYLVLSGGLGSSKYVQDEVTARYEPQGIKILADRKDPEEPYVPSFASLTVLTEQHSPLAVCKGLVLDRMQRICHGTSVFRTRSCRSSYGILFNDRYNKDKHAAQTPVECPLNGKLYVTNQIDWFIRKGEVIREDVPITREYKKRIGFKDPDKAWEDTIVMSNLPSDCLPQYLGQGDSRVVCRIESDLGQDTQTPSSPGLTARRRYWLIGQKYLNIKYELRVYVEQENLRFEVRVNTEEKGEPAAIESQWIYDQPAKDTTGDQISNSTYLTR
ncbi:hypothetical protein FGG08_002640 [Glutinoglossum americanum]|uniref:Uncharacterized protein n=1 Tax=Glutinoglossum americanum TaxID=1670608 RepID=A0A9P8I9A6_9PEZI|nr:hypothetical protein FGG08_002640 [Glutinoglossum americanum]